MTDEVSTVPFKAMGATAEWQSNALAISVALVVVELQRAWGTNAAWVYMCAILALGTVWTASLLKQDWAQRVSGVAIDIVLFLLLLCGAALSLNGLNHGNRDILAVLLFWAPVICGWWALNYRNELPRVLIYVAMLYGGLYGFVPASTDHSNHEYILVGLSVFGLVRLATRKAHHDPADNVGTSRTQAMDAAMRDPVTGVSSKVYFEAELAHMAAIANRHRWPLSLIVCRIDALEQYSEKHGEVAANELLKAAAWRIADRIRTSDTLSRLGKNEFAVLLPNTAEPDAISVAENIRQSVRTLGPDAREITAHVAVSEHRTGEDSMATMEDAYRRLDLPKKETRNDPANCTSTL